MNLIKPSVGRVVLFRHRIPAEPSPGQPTRLVDRPALIVDVHSDECCTLQVFFAPWDCVSDNGMRTSVIYVDDETSERTWRWMPYQKGQAAKTEALQAELDKTKA